MMNNEATHEVMPLKTASLILMLPFLSLMVLGRLQVSSPMAWFSAVDTPLTLCILLLVAGVGAYLSRKAGTGNLNAIHGIIGVLLTGLLLFKIVPIFLLSLLLTIIIAPIVYLIITATPPNILTRKPREGESDITVLSFILGKHKNNS